jgi:dTDP-4-dehydrorhamnose 3,5-epimerase
MLIAPVTTTPLISGSVLAGVSLHSLNPHEDERGTFTETFRQDWAAGVRHVQWSCVSSATNVFRGMHLHWRHDELFCLLNGHCLVGLYDLRPGSVTQHQSALYEFAGDQPATLLFPPGVLHGWYFFSPSMHLQAVSETFSAYASDDNHGCRWDDPALRIDWNITDPLLSERAAAFPSLAQLMATLANAEPAYKTALAAR